MNNSDLFAALDLPSITLVQQRVPKNMLVKNGAPTPGDKRKINEGIEELQWLATLKPTTIGVPEYSDIVRQYLEIAILGVEYRGNANANRLNELIHRAIPYPVVLITRQEGRLGLSLAHKRWSQNQSNVVVLDANIYQVPVDHEIGDQTRGRFLKSISLNSQPQSNMLTLYQGWIDTLTALLAASKTGSFTLSNTREQAIARHEALQEYYRIEAMMTHLRALAMKEKQIPKLVNVNLELKELETQLKKLQEKL